MRNGRWIALGVTLALAAVPSAHAASVRVSIAVDGEDFQAWHLSQAADCGRVGSGGQLVLFETKPKVVVLGEYGRGRAAQLSFKEGRKRVVYGLDMTAKGRVTRTDHTTFAPKPAGENVADCPV